ncbi:MAG: flagellar basal body L-ring protein FlgH, partial [Nitrospiria bacterium]
MENLNRKILLMAVTLVSTALLNTACSHTPKAVKHMENEKHPPPMLTAKGEHTGGSLWREGLSRNFYFQDTNASHVGDIVTVQVIENAKGTKDAKTKSGRSSKLDASTTSILGLPTVTTDKLRA